MLNLESFKQYWDKQFPDIRLRRSHFVLAVSGGVDSIVLAHIMHSLQAKCTIAHVNFQLRGAESKRDEVFVHDFALQYQIPFQLHVADTSTYATTYKMGIQEAAREIRYAWFGALLQDIAQIEHKPVQAEPAHQLSPKPKPVVLLTAHHANDQAETVLMHLFRGTGLQGLTGIPARRKDVLNIARPLLAFSKEEILAYAHLHGLHYVEDSSNDKNDYSRNFIRNSLLPQLQTIYPNVNDNIIATVHRLKEAAQIVEKAVDVFWERGLQLKKGILTVAITYWQKNIQNHTYTWGLIKKYGFNPTQIGEVHKLLNAKNGAYIASVSHQLIKWGDQIQIIDKQATNESMVIDQHMLPLIDNVSTKEGRKNGLVATKYGQLTFEYIQDIDINTISKDPNIAYLDARKLSGAMYFRTWANTDYFYPLGLGKKKKINHFLGSLKLNPAQKNKLAVLCIGDKIAWVVGIRIDDRFKLTVHTQEALKINWQEMV